MQPELLVNRGLLPELADKFQPIFFSRKPAAHRRELCLGERYSATATRRVTSPTNRLRMRRGSGLISMKRGSVRAAIFAGKLYSVTHPVRLASPTPKCVYVLYWEICAKPGVN